MHFVPRLSPKLAASLLGGLLAAAGCSSLPNGALPDNMTPAINTNPGTISNPGAVSGSPGATSPTDPSYYKPAPSNSPAPSYTPAPSYSPAPGTNGPTSPGTPAPTTAPTQPSGSFPVMAATVQNSDIANAEAYIFQQTNAERAKVGAKPLTLDPTLTSLARGRSDDMATRNYFSHYTPENKNVFDMLAALGYSYSTAGENIAMNTYPVSQSPQQIMTAWMGDQGHKDNILNVNYGRIGVGAWIRASDGAIYYTQDFSN